MQKIVPHLWFDKQAVKAAQFYVSVFEDSKIHFTSIIPDTPSGDVESVTFEIMGFQFRAISAGPIFKVNPSISFHIRCKTVDEVDRLWKQLAKDGKTMIELNEYPFSKRYGWIQDKYGVSWQIIYTEKEFTQRIVPTLMFVGDVCGKTGEAIDHYTTIFPETRSNVLARYSNDEKPDKEGTIKYAQFFLKGQEFTAMDSAHDYDFSFSEGVSMILNCANQQEIDYYWDKLSAVKEAEQCGWIKDKFGVSWQITPNNMGELLEKNPKKTTPVMLNMKKIIIKDLEKAAKDD